MENIERDNQNSDESTANKSSERPKLVENLVLYELENVKKHVKICVQHPKHFNILLTVLSAQFNYDERVKQDQIDAISDQQIQLWDTSSQPPEIVVIDKR
ncbi:MAG: hypothetical protein MHMPM18_001854 [Marteilia pararefringens]